MSSARGVVFINSTGDTFTPTHSGAIATWIWEMCRAASAAGIDPWVLSRSSPHAAYPWPQTVEIEYPYPPRIRGFGRVYEWARRRRGWTHIRQGRYLRILFRAVERIGQQAGVLMFHNDPEAAICARARFRDAKIVHLFHNCNHVSERWRAGFARAVDISFAVSSYCARWNELYFGCAVHTLLNGVDVERFRPSFKELGKGSVRFGFVGRTDRQKAPDLLLRALLKVARVRRDFELQILGSRFYGGHSPDAYQTGLQGMVEQLRERGVLVHAPGFVNRWALPRELAAADVHVVPSRWEDPCPLTVLEGMATGKACVVSRTGGVPEQAGDAALYFERDDLDGLFRTLMRLLEDADLRADYGRKARQRAEARPWKTVFRDFREAVEN